MTTVPPAPAPDRPASRLPRWAATSILLVVAVLSIVLRAVDLPERPVSLVQNDESIYHEAAVDIAHGRFPRLNDRFATKYPPLYPLLIAPARYFGTPESFPWWARFTNLLLLALALIPAYRLARRTGSREISVVIAILAMTTATQCYSITLMSENLFLPLFLWLALAVARVAAKPTTARAVVVGALLGLAILTKTHAVCAAPAILVAVAIATRRVRPTARVALVFGATAFAIVAPWQFRRHLFPSEADVTPIFSYWKEAMLYGVNSLDRHFHWLRTSYGHLPQALGPISAALAIAAVFAQLARGRPDQRAVAMFAGLSWFGFSIVTGVWSAQTEYYRPLPNERYLAFVFPLLVTMIPAAFRLAGVRALLLGAIVVATGVLAYPTGFLDPHATSSLADNPSHVFHVNYVVYELGVGWTMTLFVVAAALPLLVRRLLPAGIGCVALLLLAMLHQAATTITSREQFRGGAWVGEMQVAELGDWLSEHLRPTDALVLKEPLRMLTYHIPQMLEIDAHAVGPSFEAQHYYTALVDADNCLRVQGHDGRVLLLTREFPQWAWPVLAQHGPFRLYEVDGPIRRFGAAEIDGVWADGWAAPHVVFRHPVAPGALAKVVLEIAYPEDASYGAVDLTFRHGDTVDRRTIHRGGRLRYAATIEPRDGRVTLTVDANVAAWVDTRYLAFRVDGGFVAPVERSSASGTAPGRGEAR